MSSARSHSNVLFFGPPRTRRTYGCKAVVLNGRAGHNPKHDVRNLREYHRIYEWGAGLAVSPLMSLLVPFALLAAVLGLAVGFAVAGAPSADEVR